MAAIGGPRDGLRSSSHANPSIMPPISSTHICTHTEATQTL